jgi:hypothetical protein
LTERFLTAVAMATEVHGHARRTGTETPYTAHLLVVTGLVVEDGGDEDQAIAALLHDAVEHGGGRPMLDRIERSFGLRVARIVEACSDTVDGDRTDTWIERKRRYLEHLPEVTDDAVLRVALADKVHNARSIVRDYRKQGYGLWDRFAHKTAREHLFYYGGLLAFFAERRPGPLTEDLWRAVGELSWLVARDDAQRRARRRVWLDADLHMGQAPEGWIQARTATEAILLLAEFTIHELSLAAGPEADAVIDWLIEQESADRDPWPVDRLAFHGEDAERATDRMAAVLGLRRARHDASPDYGSPDDGAGASFAGRPRTSGSSMRRRRRAVMGSSARTCGRTHRRPS